MALWKNRITRMGLGGGEYVRSGLKAAVDKWEVSERKNKKEERTKQNPIFAGVLNMNSCQSLCRSSSEGKCVDRAPCLPADPYI